jgi:hypothetical protein
MIPPLRHPHPVHHHHPAQDKIYRKPYRVTVFYSTKKTAVVVSKPHLVHLRIAIADPSSPY